MPLPSGVQHSRDASRHTEGGRCVSQLTIGSRQAHTRTKKKVSYFPFPSVTKTTFIFSDFAKFHYNLLVWPLYTLLKLIQENVLLCNILPRIQIIYGHSLYFTHCRFSLLHLTYFLKLKALESKDCMNQSLRRTSVKQCLPHMTGKLRSWPMQ